MTLEATQLHHCTVATIGDGETLQRRCHSVNNPCRYNPVIDSQLLYSRGMHQDLVDVSVMLTVAHS